MKQRAISLLFDGQPSVGTVGEKTLYVLSLDRVFSAFYREKEKLAYFLDVLKAPLLSEETIVYRRSILRDFRENPQLFEELQKLYRRFSEIRKSGITNATEARRGLHASSPDNLPHTAKNLIQLHALALKRCMFFMRELAALLRRFEITAAGLLALRQAADTLISSEAFEKLLLLCSHFENYSLFGFLDLKLSLDEHGKICRSQLLDHRYVQINDPDLKPKGFFKKQKAAPPEDPSAVLASARHSLYNEIIFSAMQNVSFSLEAFFKTWTDQFGAIAEELPFYEVALAYGRFLDEKGIPLTFPTIESTAHKKPCMRCKNAYDLTLARTDREMIPNDIVIEGDGVLIFGANGSGKTVYLRAIGTIWLLAQAGLPVPAEDAVLSPVTKIETLFAESENSASGGSESSAAGRFEGEVRQLARMADTLPEKALLLMNEPFQSTNYDEGAAGLAPVLRYFSDRGIRWLVVSHMAQLEHALADCDIRVCRVNADHKVTLAAEN